ncbi:hypothetical protein K438DRAFT_1772419 [Mycena galopus ATCC 62051]|nr:hypothetical protein K438DRAFT_1772419 [Mycena galopus ATCC 62051]
MSTKYLKNRKFNQALKNIAFWDETGWAWFIPLHNGTVSVGVVLNDKASRRKKANLQAPDQNKVHYLAQLELAPGVIHFLENAILASEIKSAGDYSYCATQHAGPNFRIAGDAGAFIDPFFSSGVHLAFAGGLSAAASIAASIREQCTEEEASSFHTEKIGASYTSTYRQINAQAAPVLSDIDEDNFDRAFDFLKPVIQGSADTDRTITEETLQRTMDFCEHAMAPTSPEMHAAVAARLDVSLLAPEGPMIGTGEVVALVGNDEEAKQVLWRVNARKAVAEMLDWEGDFESETSSGFSVVLERTRLGLRRMEVGLDA